MAVQQIAAAGAARRASHGGCLQASFEEGEYSATDLDSPPLLTINAPIGLNLRDNPEQIINRSVVQNNNNAEEITGLEVSSGNNLTLVGGDINFEGGNLTATGGRIELGGLSQAGTVAFNSDGSLGFPTDVARADVTLSNAAVIDVRGTGGGDVAINARNLTLQAGETVGSAIAAGISTESTDPQAQAGDITIDATDNVTVDRSTIANRVNSGVVGIGGDVAVTTDTLSVSSGGQVGTSTFGRGNAGGVEIIATGDLNFDGEDLDGFTSRVFSLVNSGAEGDTGGLRIETNNLTLTNGGQVASATLGRGNTGLVEIIATGDIRVDGETSGGLPSGIANQVTSDAIGDAGGIKIETANLTLTNGGLVSAVTEGQGNAGLVEIIATGDIRVDGETSGGIRGGVNGQVLPDAEGDAEGIRIETDNLTLTNGGGISASTFSRGNAGLVEIIATGDIIFDGETSEGPPPSGITSRVNSGAEGDAGGVRIETDNLTLTNGGQVDVTTFGRGNAGLVEIIATGDLRFDGDSAGLGSGVISLVEEDAEGDTGGVRIETANLTMTNGGRVSASTFGRGNAGLVEIIATGDLRFDGETSAEFASGVSSLVNPGAEGDATGVRISSTNLTLTNGGQISASTISRGNAGSVEITATDNISIDGENSRSFPSGTFSQVASGGEGNGGNVTITTDTLSVTNGGVIDASTFSKGSAGSVEITATDSILIDGESSRESPSAVVSQVNPRAEGNGGNVTVATDTLSVTNGGAVSTGTAGQGNAGEVTIEADSISLNGDDASISSSTNSGNGGIINLSVASTLTLDNDSFIAARAFEEADGGNLSIDAQFIVAFPNSNNDLVAAAEQGQGGIIDINAESVLGIQERPLTDTTNDINASSEVDGLDGTVNINTLDIDPVQGSTELPNNIVVPEQTTQQACQSNREAEAQNGLNIVGKGGVPPAPELPLNSLNTVSNGEMNPVSNIPAPIETSKGKIQPARGIEVTPSGVVKLTAYPTNNQGDRRPEIKPNCG